MVTELNEANLEQIIAREGIALVDCWAPWCRNCDDFGEVYERTAKRHPAHRFCSLDTEEQKKIRSVLGIQHLPTLMVFRDGLLLFKQAGSFDEEALASIIEQTASLDMDQVRFQLDAESSSSAA